MWKGGAWLTKSNIWLWTKGGSLLKLSYFKKTKSDNTEVFLLLGRERQSHLVVKYINLGVRFVVISSLSRVQLFATPWAAKEPARLFCPWDFPVKNTGVGCRFLLKGILPTQGKTLPLLHWQVDSLLTEPPAQLY